MFKRIDHIELVTREPERAIRFYSEVLGFKLRARTAFSSCNTSMSKLD
jgi:catechol 2,3-dioxygenase-like lactoylglutathione lyase family enzyme